MSNDKWSIFDEFQRIVESYAQKPPTITELLDMYHQLIPTTKSGTGFDGLVDDPRTEKKETPVKNSRVRNKVYLFTCPACQEEVRGTGHYELASDALPTLDDSGKFVAEMKLVGIEADTHICLPGAWD